MARTYHEAGLNGTQVHADNLRAGKLIREINCPYARPSPNIQHPLRWIFFGNGRFEQFSVHGKGVKVVSNIHVILCLLIVGAPIFAFFVGMICAAVFMTIVIN